MKYDIWSEGYLATGMEGYPAKAQLVHANIEGDTFNDACRNWATLFPDEAEGYGGLRFYDNIPQCWVCRLFPTEEEARKSFG